MVIKKLLWDSDCVSWFHNEKIVKIKFSDINFVNLDIQEKHIYVVCGKEFSENNICYLSFDGMKLLLYDKILGKVSWEYEGRIVEVNNGKIENARLYGEDEMVMVIIMDERGNEKLLGYQLDGMLLFEAKAPADYRLLYLSSVSNKPSVVCEGDPENADIYGRNTLHFIIDIKKGELIESNLAY